MAQITTNQHSYSNASALLNVKATAKRTGPSTISITADWSIYTAASYHSGGTRYLVLMIGSESGAKYYSTAIGTNWSKQTTYDGSYTFTGIPLNANSTEITIGFGVSASKTSMSSSGTLIWNGSAEVSSSAYDPDIQFRKIAGIEKGYTACTAPTSFVLSPEVFESDPGFTLTWSGAKGGTNNAITGYELQVRTRNTSTSNWGGWISSSITNSGATANLYDLVRGGQAQYRIRTKGTAGEAYYSPWEESNVVRKAKPNAYIHKGTKPVPHGVYIQKGTDFVRHYPYKYDGEKWVPCSE